jgi:hypothetical protein
MKMKTSHEPANKSAAIEVEASLGDVGVYLSVQSKTMVPRPTAPLAAA